MLSIGFEQIDRAHVRSKAVAKQRRYALQRFRRTGIFGQELSDFIERDQQNVVRCFDDLSHHST